ncbi:dUTP diphosphatase [Paracoccus cavernae]|uniref:dUTP diphosphatase n=1 Tax=Paracoccus cavernae TaxID=1571207 RepID=UPI0035F48BC1
MPDIRILVMRDEGADPALPLPDYQTAGAAGADLRADLAGRDLTLEPGDVKLVPTGLRVEIPHGFEMQVRPRSGLALKYGVTVANAPGTVDSDYRGPLGVILVNLGREPFVIAHGERIAQAVIAPVVQARYVMAETLSESDRASGGFGSTGRS